MTQEFKHQDKLKVIALAENNSHNRNPRKSITVQHFNDSGQPDAPAEVVVCEMGHSPVAIESINGGYYLAKENDPQAATEWQDQGRQNNQNQNQSQPAYSR